MCIHTCVQVYVCVCMCARSSQRKPQVSSPKRLSNSFEIESLIRPELSSRSPSPSCLCLPGTEVMRAYITMAFVCALWGLNSGHHACVASTLPLNHLLGPDPPEIRRYLLHNAQSLQDITKRDFGNLCMPAVSHLDHCSPAEGK